MVELGAYHPILEVQISDIRYQISISEVRSEKYVKFHYIKKLKLKFWNFSMDAQLQ